VGIGRTQDKYAQQDAKADAKEVNPLRDAECRHLCGPQLHTPGTLHTTSKGLAQAEGVQCVVEFKLCRTHIMHTISIIDISAHCGSVSVSLGEFKQRIFS
jgi:hypothetical protein